MYNGQPIADSLVLSHDSELSRLASATPEAAHIGVVAGDPCFDRMLRSEHLREGYRRELGVQPGQQLVTITTTWSPRSLMGSWPSLFREVLACLPTDEYRVAAVIHPNIWHGHGPWQVHTWLADCVRAGLILLPPTEGWQAILIASDLVLGDYGATTCYAAGLAKPTLLAAFPDEAVAPGSVAASLGRTAPSLDRHASLRTQIDRTIREHTPSHTVRDALTSCPGEAAARLRTLFYEYLRLPELAADALVPVIPPTSVTTLPRAAATADHVVCTLNEAGDVATITRYPADVTTSTSDDGHLDAARLAVHEDHPRRQLLDEAAIIIAPSLHADGIWRDHPGADVVVSPSAADWVVSMRDGARIVLRADDPAAAASVVHEWLVTGRSFANWPEQVTIVAGPRTTTALTLSVALA